METMTGTSTSDAELWRRAADGDHAAFTALFERHASAVWNHAYRLTGSWAMAEDVGANTFLAAWRKRREVTLVRDSALPWLYAVAGNLVRNEHRRSGRFLRALRRPRRRGGQPGRRRPADAPGRRRRSHLAQGGARGVRAVPAR
jgi:RNA polymerase sigma-70 factor, ECF subfamily